MTKQEEQIQANCYQWFHNTFHGERQMLFHIDNNSWNAIIGAKKKALGVNAGVADLCLIYSLGRTLWIEMKAIGGVQSEDQIKFEAKVKARGHEYVLCDNMDDFQELILRKLINHG